MAFATKPKPPASHKKRAGKHRKHNEQYLKHYWPYLPLLAIVMVGLLCNLLWPTGAAVLGARSDLTSASLLADTNQERLTHQEKALSLNDSLNQAAQTKALDMVAGNYWSHNTPDGKTPWTFIAATGYNYAKAGENLAYGFSDADAAVSAWMHSPEHRRNILDDGYSQVGFGIASSPNFAGHGPQTIIVAMYARPAAAAVPMQFASTEGSVKGAELTSAPVTRLAVMTDTDTQLMTVLVISATALAAAIFLTKHSRLLHKSLVRGEVFVAHHLLFDSVLVVVITGGVLLSRSAGFIV